MTLRFLVLLAIVLGMGLAACDDGRKAPPRTTIQVIDAAPGAPSLEFRREQSTPYTLVFRQSTELDVGEDTYDFNVTVPGEHLMGTTFNHTVLSGIAYNVVLTELGGVVYPAVIEIPSLPADSTNIRLAAFHGAEDQPPYDFYVAPPDTVLASTTPVASLAFGQASSTFDLPAGLYRLSLTAPGDPSAVAFESSVLTLTPGLLASFALAGDGGDTASTYSVLLTRTSTGTNSLHDRNLSSQVRVLNAAADAAPRDVLVNGATPPLFASVPFGALTEYGPAPADAFAVSVTPPGNPGVIEAEDTLILGGPYLQTVLIAGETGALTISGSRDNNRRYPTVAKIRFFNGATQFETGVDVYLTPPGSPITSVFPVAGVGPGAASSQGTIAPREYDLYVAGLGTTEVLFGPLAVTLEPNGIYSVLVTNGASTATADVVLLDDFQ